MRKTLEIVAGPLACFAIAGVLAAVLLSGILAAAPAVDPSTASSRQFSDPATDGWSVDGDGITASSLSDTVDQVKVCRAFSVGVAGNVKVTTMKGTTLIIPMQAGQEKALRVTRFWSGSTTATGITAIGD